MKSICLCFLTLLMCVFANNVDATQKIMVVVPEYYVGRYIQEPTGETEIIKRLVANGYTVVDQKQVERIRDTEFIRAAMKGDKKKAQEVALQYGADVLIVGEAFSEYAGQVVNGLYSCRARVEARAFWAESGEILAADGKHASGIDSAESIANKKALQKAGGAIADYFVAELKTKLAANSTRQISTQDNADSALSQGSFPKSNAINTNGIAVIVGNRNYSMFKKGIPNVDYANNDARVMYRFVVETLGFPEGNVILLNDATQADMVAVFGSDRNPVGKLSNWVQPGKSDVFVFYSGHGAPSLSDGKGYLLPVDADSLMVELNGYPLETLYTNLEKLPVNHLTIVIDACFSGSFSSGTIVKSASSISLRVVEPNKTIKNSQIFTAAAPLEVASWDESAKHGMFTYYFISGAIGAADSNKDKIISIAEIKSYLESNVTFNARKNFNREQHPQIVGDETATVNKY